MNLFAVDKTSSSFCQIDPESLAVLKRLPMPPASHDFVFSPSGKQAFISIYGAGTYRNNPNPGHEIVVVDLERFVAAGSIDLSPYTSPHGLAFDRRGILWAACDAHARLLGIFPETGSILHVADTRSTGSHWVLASSLTGDLYTSNKNECFLSVIDASRAKFKASVPVPHGAEGICFGPEDRFLYTADHKQPAVLEIDAESLAIRRTIEIAGLPDALGGRADHHMRAHISPDGSTLAVAAYHFDKLVLVSLAMPSEQIVVGTGDGPTAMAFHPDSPAKLYFSNHDEGSVGIIDTRTGNIVKTAFCDAGFEVMRFL